MLHVVRRDDSFIALFPAQLTNDNDIQRSDARFNEQLVLLAECRVSFYLSALHYISPSILSVYV